MIWPKEHWALLIQFVLKGKAQEIYTQLSLEQASNYDTVKEAILKGYELSLKPTVKNFETVKNNLAKRRICENQRTIIRSFFV